MNAILLRIVPRYFCTTLLAAALGMAVVPSVSAQTIISDPFDYGDDASLLLQWARVTGTDASIFLAPDPANAVNQAIQQTTAAGRLRHVFTGTVPTDATPLVFSFDFYDTTGGTTSGRVYGELRNSAGAVGLLAAGLYNSANTGVYDQTKYQARNVDSGNWIQLATARSVGWHNFRFEIFGSTVDLYVDGQPDPNFTDLTYLGNVTYDWAHIGSALSGNTAGYFDNVYLATVPEPSSLMLGLVLGVGALLGCNRLRHR